MGTSSSRWSSSFGSQRLSREEVDPRLLERFDFDAHADRTGGGSVTMTIEQLMTVFSQQTDVYLSYSWGYHKKHQQLVSRINDILLDRGLRTFFDRESLPINVSKQLYAAINNTNCIVLFLSQEYVDKLSSDLSPTSLAVPVWPSCDNNDCLLEFEYIIRSVSVDRIVPVLLDVGLSEEGRVSNDRLAQLLRRNRPIDLTRCCSRPHDSSIALTAAIARAGREIYDRVTSLLCGGSLQSLYATLNFDFVFERQGSSSCERDYSSCRTLVGHGAAVRTVTELKFGGVVSGSSDKRLIIWDLDASDSALGDAIVRPRKIIHGHVDEVLCVIQLADERLCSGGSDGAIKVWDLANHWTEGSCDRTMRGHTQAVTALVQLRDGRLCSSSEDCSIRLWDLSSYQCIDTLQGFGGGAVTRIVQLRDASLCSSSADGSIRWWDQGVEATTLRCVGTVQAHDSAVNCVLELQQQQQEHMSSAICTGGEDSTIKVWDPQTPLIEPTVLLRGHWSGVLSVAELRGGRLVSASRDMKVKIWDLTRCKRSSFWSHDDYCELTLLGHRSSVCQVVQLRDRRIVSASDDNTLKVWG